MTATTHTRRLVSTTTAASMLDITARGIRSLIADGSLTGYRRHDREGREVGPIKVDVESIDAWLSRTRIRPTTGLRTGRGAR